MRSTDTIFYMKIFHTILFAIINYKKFIVNYSDHIKNFK